MKKFLFFALCYFVPFQVFSQELWKVKSSDVGFSIRNAGLFVDGSFSGMVASIRFSPANPENSQIEAFVYPASINTGISKRDKHLKSSDYFHIEKYPRIIMKSVKIEPLGQNKFMGYFQLTVKDVTKEINFPFIFEKNGNSGVFKGGFTLNRLDYNVGGSSWLLQNQVDVTLKVEVSAGL